MSGEGFKVLLTRFLGHIKLNYLIKFRNGLISDGAAVAVNVSLYIESLRLDIPNGVSTSVTRTLKDNMQYQNNSLSHIIFGFIYIYDSLSVNVKWLFQQVGLTSPAKQVSAMTYM